MYATFINMVVYNQINNKTFSCALFSARDDEVSHVKSWAASNNLCQVPRDHVAVAHATEKIQATGSAMH